LVYAALSGLNQKTACSWGVAPSWIIGAFKARKFGTGQLQESVFGHEAFEKTQTLEAG
jgi:hypothetical protein